MRFLFGASHDHFIPVLEPKPFKNFEVVGSLQRRLHQSLESHFNRIGVEVFGNDQENRMCGWLPCLVNQQDCRTERLPRQHKSKN